MKSDVTGHAEGNKTHYLKSFSLRVRKKSLAAGSSYRLMRKAKLQDSNYLLTETISRGKPLLAYTKATQLSFEAEYGYAQVKNKRKYSEIDNISKVKKDAEIPHHALRQ